MVFIQHMLCLIYATVTSGEVKKGSSGSFLIRDPEDSTSARFGRRRRINWLLPSSCGSSFSLLPPASVHVFKATACANIDSQKESPYGRKHYVPDLNMRAGLSLLVHPSCFS